MPAPTSLADLTSRHPRQDLLRYVARVAGRVHLFPDGGPLSRRHQPRARTRPSRSPDTHAQRFLWRHPARITRNLDYIAGLGCTASGSRPCSRTTPRRITVTTSTTTSPSILTSHQAGSDRPGRRGPCPQPAAACHPRRGDQSSGDNWVLSGQRTWFYANDQHSHSVTGGESIAHSHRIAQRRALPPARSDERLRPLSRESARRHVWPEGLRKR